MSLQRDCYAVLGRLARRLRERHRLQMKTIAAAVLDDLPQYRVEVHVGNEGPVVSVDTRPD